MPVLRGTALSLKSMRVFSWTWLQHTVKVFFNHDYLKVAVTHLKLKRQIWSYACVVRIPVKTISDGQNLHPRYNQYMVKILFPFGEAHALYIAYIGD